MINIMFPNGRTKAFTLSYDDGVSQDKRLVKLLNTYRLKATFNLNSSLQNEDSFWIGKNDTFISRMNTDELEQVYLGHEIAVHSLTHPHLEHLPPYEAYKELFEDKKNLELLFAEIIRGMAYPYGTYNNTIKQINKMIGLNYCRTVNDTYKFDAPMDFLEWNPTCHHSYPGLFSLAQEFIDLAPDRLSIFYVWGHSYEFDEDNNWDMIEQFSSIISDKEDIWYATNGQIYDYITAASRLVYSADGAIVYNPTDISIWLKTQNKSVEIQSGQTIAI